MIQFPVLFSGAILVALTLGSLTFSERARAQGYEGKTREAIQAEIANREAKYKRYRDAGLQFIRQADGFGRYLSEVPSDSPQGAYVAEDGVVLNPAEFNLVDLGASFLAARDPKNWNQLYRLVIPRLPRELAHELPRIRQFESFKLRRKRLVWERTLDLLERNPGKPGGTAMPSKPILADCTKEKGYEVAGTDSEVSARCTNSQFASLGIMRNVSFPLKDNLTCVKDQARRGTCVAHATIATVESLRSVISNELKNLSEQDLYFEAEANGSGTDFLDGVNTGLALDHFDAANYDIQLESEWNYLRATNRNSPPEARHPTNLVNYYPGQCGGNYSGEMCTEYASSGEHDFLFPGVPSSARRPPVPSKGEEEIIGVTLLPLDPSLLWPAQEPVIQMLLADDFPAIIASSITDDFSNYDSNGYVRYTGSTLRSGEKPGNHAMELIGYVANAALPANAPNATGHGYYVVKNSWGTSKADCGFYYVDSEYFRNRAHLVAFVTIKS